MPFVLAAFSPLVIPGNAVLKYFRNGLKPWYFVPLIPFMGARIFGTIKGMYRRAYKGVNVR